MKIEWKNIKGYNGNYSISNTGIVRSKSKILINKNGKKYHKKNRILKLYINTHGYLKAHLCKNSISKTIDVHILVWDHFGNRPRNGSILLVDHIDENKQNNRIDNLQLLTNSENIRKSYKYKKTHKKKTSQYIGVSFDKKNNNWKARIRINYKEIFLGRFDDEHDAHLAYQDALKNKNSL